ncbi:MAG: LolA family protein [Gemmatimonadota bacterium]
MGLRACAALAALLAVSASAASGAESGDALLRRVGERYAGVRSLSASFRQEVPLQNLGIVRRASGKVWFERPLKMRWDYTTPEAQLFLADGTYFYYRPSGSSQVYRKKIDEKALGGKVPLLLLFGKGDIAGMFRVEETVARKWKEETGLRLVPRDGAAPDVRRVDLVVGTADLLVREVHIYDRLGGENHLYLDAVVLDPSLPPGLFRFRKSPGEDVVDG